jgi:heme/copper-type cytochrome/quinol oxidase subunit 3
MTAVTTHEAAAVAADHGHDDHPTAMGISNEKLAMWAFLGSECLLFGGLISTYLIYKNRPGVVPLKDASAGGLVPTGVKISHVFDIGFTSASSFILLASSLTMVFAVTAAARRQQDRTRLWLGVTAFLGAIFVGGQAYEFTEFINKGFGFTSNVSTSAFYVLTGFHGVHVTVGIIMLLVTLATTFRARQPKPEAVEIVGLYWHFVDVVWILIFTVIYLIK